MADNNKEIHIVFQVTNFILSPRADELKLLPIERLLLLALAKHHGKRGIYPSTHTLSKELSKSPTYIKRIINRLDKLGIIFVDRKFGTCHHYFLLFLSTDRSTAVDQSTTVDRSTAVSGTGQLQVHDRSTAVDTINTDNQFRRSKQRERAQKKRAPLPDSFLPDKRLHNFLNETANKSGRSADQLITKFKNLQKSKDGMSADWNAEFENFLLNERPMGYTGSNGHANGEVKSTVKFFHDPTHPSYETFKQMKEEEKPKDEVVEKPEEYLSFREAKRRYELRLQHGELDDAIPRDRVREKDIN
jgi:hypothetical protein